MHFRIWHVTHSWKLSRSASANLLLYRLTFTLWILLFRLAPIFLEFCCLDWHLSSFHLVNIDIHSLAKERMMHIGMTNIKKMQALACLWIHIWFLLISGWRKWTICIWTSIRPSNNCCRSRASPDSYVLWICTSIMFLCCWMRIL